MPATASLLGARADIVSNHPYSLDAVQLYLRMQPLHMHFKLGQKITCQLS
jgi:hypothetical protein